MLGIEIAHFFEAQGYEVLRPRHQEVDIVDYNVVYAYLSQQKPDVIINAAGKTGTPNMIDVKHTKKKTVLTNVNGAVNVSCAAKLLGIYNAYIGSGCIYQGDNNGKGFTEQDAPNYTGSFYSRTKVRARNYFEPFDVLQLYTYAHIYSKKNPRNLIDG